MGDEHHMAWVEVLTEDGWLCRRFLGPGGSPEVELPYPAGVTSTGCGLPP